MPEENENVKIEGNIEDLEKNTQQTEPKTEKTIDDVLSSIENIGKTISGIDERVGKLEIPEITDETTGLQEDGKDDEENKEDGWKPKTWEDVDKRAEEKARNIIKEEDEKKAKEQEEFEKSKKNADEEFDRQLTDAESKGIIPKIEDAENFDDSGRAARREIIGMAVKSKTLDLGAMAETWKNLTEHGIHFNVKTGKFIKSERVMDNKSVPVGSSNSTTPTNKARTDYDEIHKARDYHDLV